jgi:hypothetical protein
MKKLPPKKLTDQLIQEQEQKKDKKKLKKKLINHTMNQIKFQTMEKNQKLKENNKNQKEFQLNHIHKINTPDLD